MNTRRLASITSALSLVALASVMVACGADGDVSAPEVRVLSSSADYVSGGDALIEISLPAEGLAPAFVATLNGRNISSAFRLDSRSGRMVGLVSGLTVGANVIKANFSGKEGSLTLTNYPITGPMRSGPHTLPFNCQTQSFLLPDGSNLGAATDAQCSAPTKVMYLYRATSGGALRAMPDTSRLPADVAETTPVAGVKVPFVVRVETGTMNRGIYQNAMLHDPTSDAAPSAVTPPRGWNRKLIAVHGTGCTGGWYVQGAALGVSTYTGTMLTRLGEGYAVFNNTLNHPTISCNAVVAAETTMMGKERLIELLGVPTATVSTGTSGGAYTSLQVGDAIPGIFDGVFIDATFPDALSIALSALDAKLLNRYLTAAELNTSGITEAQMVKVSGHKSARAWYDLALQSGRTDPTPGRTETIPVAGFAAPYAASVFGAAVPASQRYNAASNPGGARATVWDWARNVYGVDASGKGQRVFDNVGVQYGLAQLNDGTLSKAQFLDLNAKAGGYDSEGNYMPARSVADANAVRRTYQSGLSLGGGGGLASIPVFDASNFYDEDNFYHYQWFHFAVRERMRRANGDAANHVMWRGGVNFADLFVPASANPARVAINTRVATDGWAAFIKWVDAYKADTGGGTAREKVIARKPAEAVDGCFTVATPPLFKAETQTVAQSGTAGSCNELYPSWTFPRLQAGGPLAADVLKCQLKAVDVADYRVSFNAAEIERLRAIFPAGVCDFSKPGTNQTGVVTHASFGPSPVNLVFDITRP
jgi:Tannase-like family of unknown function (DUF6351)